MGRIRKGLPNREQRLEQSRNAVRIMELMQRSGLSPMPFQKPLIEIDPSKAPLEKL